MSESAEVRGTQADSRHRDISTSVPRTCAQSKKEQKCAERMGVDGGWAWRWRGPQGRGWPKHGGKKQQKCAERLGVDGGEAWQGRGPQGRGWPKRGGKKLPQAGLNEKRHDGVVRDEVFTGGWR